VILEHALASGECVRVDSSGDYDPATDDYEVDEWMTQYEYPDGTRSTETVNHTPALVAALKAQAREDWHSIDWDAQAEEDERRREEEADYWLNYGWDAYAEGGL